MQTSDPKNDSQLSRRTWIFGLVVGLIGAFYCGVGALQQIWLSTANPNADQEHFKQLAQLYGVGWLAAIGLVVFSTVRIIRIAREQVRSL